MDDDWLSLKETAVLLGVHPSTVRAWADRGELPFQRTAGGHRRFRRADVSQRTAVTERNQRAGAHLIIQNALGRTRLELTEGILDQETWYALLNESAKQELREIGRRLLTLFSDTLSQLPAPSGWQAQAQTIGADYYHLGQKSGLSLAETTRAYLFFRECLTTTVTQMALATGPQSPTDWEQLHRQIIDLANEVLLALITEHEKGKSYE